LRDGTVELHRALEARLDLLALDLDRERYARVLSAMYGYYLPLEAALEERVAAAPIALPLRPRAPLAADDLAVLGLGRAAVAALPTCAALPTLRGRDEIAGCLYVIEGACLGGQVIASAVAPRLGLTPGRGCRFFAGGDDVAGRWAAVVAWLDGPTAHDGPRAVASARETFESLGRWLAAREVLR
jgi:heme oxygenase